MSIAEIKSHPWFLGPCASMDEIKKEFGMRF